MRREAAAISADRLKDIDTALTLYRELFQENGGDEVALSSVDAFAALLDDGRLDDELVTLWEQQAIRAAEATDAKTAIVLWERAAALAEQRLRDGERALADYRNGAALGGAGSLEALARAYTERGEHQEAAGCLEQICEKSPKEQLVDNVIRLADAYRGAGDVPLERASLERALSQLGASEPIADRLRNLYEAEGDWETLAQLLTSQAAATDDRSARLAYLTRAVELHVSKLGRPQATIPILEQLVLLEPDDATRRLSLAEALLDAKRTEDAIGILEQQIERYGARKPKDRALVHYALARASGSDRKRALRELEMASRIDPSHAGVLLSLARTASSEGLLDLAEHTYHALLMLCRGPREELAPLTRGQVLTELAEIADRKKEPERAAELRASAKEARSIRPPAPSERPRRTTDRPPGVSHRNPSGRSRPAGR